MKELNTQTELDTVLMARAGQGDQHALAQLVKRYEKPLYNYILRMSGQHANAEDLFQETWLKVYRFRERYQEGKAFKPWLYQIATNVCRDWGRKRGRAKEVSLETVEGSLHIASRETPLHQAQQHELAEALHHAIAELPEKQRSVFWMARYDEMTYDEIALTLDIPVGTVKSRINHAVRKLRITLEPRHNG